MKSRTKSTREQLTLDSKSRRISEEGNKSKKVPKKDQTETRKYLLKTLTLLQQQVRLQKPDRKSNNAILSASVYEAVKMSMGQLSSLANKTVNDYSSSFNNVSNKENLPHQANRSTASLLNVSTINAKRRSNSTLDDYFKEKFGSPAKDEETIEKKLRVLKALKRSQQIVSRAGQNTTTVTANRPNNSLLQDISDKNSLMLMQRMRGRKCK